MIKKNKNKKLKRKIKNSFHGSHDRLTKYQKYNIMVTMQKRASGLQVRRHSFVNFNYNTPFRVMHLEAGRPVAGLLRDCVKNLFPMLGFNLQ